VLSTNGDTFLGGEDVDSALAHHFIGLFEKEHGIKVDETDMLGVYLGAWWADSNVRANPPWVNTRISNPVILRQHGSGQKKQLSDARLNWTRPSLRPSIFHFWLTAKR
jgi:hypothetical protein